MDYATLKLVHQGAVVLSVFGFFVRGLASLAGASWVRSRMARSLPHVVDTVLLLSALGLAWMLRLTPGNSSWLLAKIVGLVVYVLLGIVALRPDRPRAVRVTAWLAALARRWIVSCGLKTPSLCRPLRIRRDADAPTKRAASAEQQAPAVRPIRESIATGPIARHRPKTRAERLREARRHGEQTLTVAIAERSEVDERKRSLGDGQDPVACPVQHREHGAGRRTERQPHRGADRMQPRGEASREQRVDVPQEAELQQSSGDLRGPDQRTDGHCSGEAGAARLQDARQMRCHGRAHEPRRGKGIREQDGGAQVAALRLRRSTGSDSGLVCGRSCRHRLRHEGVQRGAEQQVQRSP